MKDLEYIVSLGFSGADVWRALIIAFFVAMLIGKRSTVWRVALVALVIDRLIWPITGQALSGANIHTIYASIAAVFKTLPADLGMHTVRYLGLTIMIAFFVAVRKRIHDMAPSRKGKHAAA